MRRTGSPVVAGLSALLAVVLLGGCDLAAGTAIKQGGTAVAEADGSSGYDPTDDDEQAIAALMDARAAAVAARDRRAFRATVDPRQPRLVASQMALFGNLVALPVESLTYEVSTTYLVPADVPGRDPVLHPQLLEQLQLTATTTRPVTNALDMTFVKRGEEWLVGAERPPGARGAVEDPQERPWFGVPISVRREGGLTVLVDAADEQRLPGLVTAVQDGVRRGAELFDVEPDEQVLVDATSNGQAESFGTGVDARVAAVTFSLLSGSADGGDAEVAGTAVKINPRKVDELVDDERLLWHELTHYLLFEHTTGSPSWLTEGVAAWSEWQPTRMSGLVVPDELYDRLQAAEHELPTNGVFYGKPDLDYPIGQAAVQWLVDRDGVGTLLELMRAYDRLADGPDTDANTVRALRRVYGISEKELVAGTWATLASLNR